DAFQNLLKEDFLAENQKFFLWHTWFADVFNRSSNQGFDVVIGNPPYGAKITNDEKDIYEHTYVTAKTIKGIQKGSLDTFTLFIEHGYNIIKSRGTLAYIVPISITSSEASTGVHNLLFENCKEISISSYAVRPEPVFKNAVVNTSIIMFTKTLSKCEKLLSTKMYRKKGNDFSLKQLVNNLKFVNVKGLELMGRIPKIGSDIEKHILMKIKGFKTLNCFLESNGKPIFYRTSGGRYFKVVTNYPTGSTKEKPIFFKKDFADAIGCILSSSLSFWFYQIYSNNLDWKSYEIENFTIPDLTEKDIDYLNDIYERYLSDIEDNANVRVTTEKSKYLVQNFKEYKIVRSKSIIDGIDDYICPLYGLTKEETEFIKNYELEFRMSGE
ncbi:MAG: Eco57I restriction-modification methylase domain-containing protein, partial [Bacteroidales bacterium]|nr:Eco57I restriction-modification methylase domain-containing protein [Bacteroidales bacterium]